MREEVEITGFNTYIVSNPWKPWIFVRLETNVGIHGIGEATVLGKPRTVASAVDEMSRYFVGVSPFETERLFLQMYRDEAYSDNVINTTVISAVDIACWDIKGKLLDKPVYDLLGGTVQGDRIRAYANGWYTQTDRNPEKFAEAAEAVVDDGYDALKFDPFGDAWERMTRAEVNHSIEIVRAVRQAVGPDIDLLIEGHGRFTPGMAVEIAKELQKFKPTWFEEPTPHDSVEALRKVAAKSPIPIASGERLMSKYPFRDLLQETDVDIIQPDLANTGGVTEGKKIAAMAESEHVSFAPHNPQGPVSTAVSAHVDASVPNFMIQEVFQDYDIEWVVDLLEDPIEISDGSIVLPDGPGFGINLDMDVVQEHEYTAESDNVKHLNLFEEGWETRSFTDKN